MKYYYLIIFLILTALAFYEIFSADKSKVKIFRIFAFFLVFSTAAFRYETGVDWRVYEELYAGQAPLTDIFRYDISSIFAFGYEPGYALFCSIFRSFGPNIQLLFFFAALINVLLLYRFLNTYSKYPILALLGYYSFIFFILDMSGLRQAIALNILFFGYKYFLDRKFFKYLLVVILAAQFHRTAYVLIILYPLLTGKGSAILKFGSVYLVSLVIVLLKVGWLEKATTLILPIITENGGMNDNIIKYIFAHDGETYSSIVKISIPVLLAVYFYLNRKVLLNDHIGRIIFKGVLTYGIINNLLYELPEMNSRINAYVIIFVALGFCVSIEHTYRLINKLLLYLCVVIYLFLYSGVYLMEGKAVLPYSPYQNYLIYEVFDIKSTGEKRLDQFNPQ